MTIATLKNINLEDEFKEKAALNHLRYRSSLFQDGDYTEARRLVKSREKPIIDEFYGIDI
jgi:hypothetical protein